MLTQRRRSESNRRIADLQSAALPLGHGAGLAKLTAPPLFAQPALCGSGAPLAAARVLPTAFRMSDFGRLDPRGAPARRRRAAQRRTRAPRPSSGTSSFADCAASACHAEQFYTTVGIFLIVGIVDRHRRHARLRRARRHVRSGGTQAFDVAVLRWLGAASHAAAHRRRRRDHATSAPAPSCS